MCSSDDLAFDTFARRDRGDGEPVGAMLVGLSLKNRGHSPCQLKVTAAIELRRNRDSDALVRGNPHRLDFDYRLMPGDEIGTGAWWYDWCGNRSGKWRVEVDVDGYSGQARLEEPDCQHRDAGSFLI